MITIAFFALAVGIVGYVIVAVLAALVMSMVRRTARFSRTHFRH